MVVFILPLGLLAAGLSNGRVAMWKGSPGGRRCPKSVGIDCERRSMCSGSGSLTAETGSGFFEPESHWQAQPIIDVLQNHGDEQFRENIANNFSIENLAWDPIDGALAVSFGTGECESLSSFSSSYVFMPAFFAAASDSSSGLFILQQRPLGADLGGSGSACLQTEPHSLVVVSSESVCTSKGIKENLDLSPDQMRRSLLCGISATANEKSTETVSVAENNLCIEEQLKACFCTKVKNLSSDLNGHLEGQSAD